jgi:iron complex outermembrane receptor protein
MAFLGLTAYTGGQIDTEAWSVFGDVTYDINDKWSVSVGLRWTDDERDADVFRASYLGIGSPAFGNDDAILNAITSDYQNDETFDNLAPRINVTYRINEDAQVYAGYSQGWKAGSFDPRGANFETPEAAEGFDEETLDSYEVGLKADWLDGRLRTNIAAFYSEYDDMQIPGSVGVDTDGDGVNDDFVGTVTNAGQSEISGIEVEGNWLLTERFSAQFAYSYLDAEITEWILNGVDVSDDRAIQNTPENMAFLGLTYVADAFGGTLNLNANWSYKDDIQQFEIASPDIDQDSYSLYNASAVWLSPQGTWSLGLHGKNLGDEDVRTAGYCFGFQDCPSSLGLENNTTVFYAPPRTWTATVEYNFQ